MLTLNKITKGYTQTSIANDTNTSELSWRVKVIEPIQKCSSFPWLAYVSISSGYLYVRPTGLSYNDTNTTTTPHRSFEVNPQQSSTDVVNNVIVHGGLQRLLSQFSISLLSKATKILLNIFYYCQRRNHHRLSVPVVDHYAIPLQSITLLKQTSCDEKDNNALILFHVVMNRGPCIPFILESIDDNTPITNTNALLTTPLVSSITQQSLKDAIYMTIEALNKNNDALTEIGNEPQNCMTIMGSSIMGIPLRSSSVSNDERYRNTYKDSCVQEQKEKQLKFNQEQLFIPRENLEEPQHSIVHYQNEHLIDTINPIHPNDLIMSIQSDNVVSVSVNDNNNLDLNNCSCEPLLLRDTNNDALSQYNENEPPHDQIIINIDCNDLLKKQSELSIDQVQPLTTSIYLHDLDSHHLCSKLYSDNEIQNNNLSLKLESTTASDSHLEDNIKIVSHEPFESNNSSQNYSFISSSPSPLSRSSDSLDSHRSAIKCSDDDHHRLQSFDKLLISKTLCPKHYGLLNSDKSDQDSCCYCSAPPAETMQSFLSLCGMHHRNARELISRLWCPMGQIAQDVLVNEWERKEREEKQQVLLEALQRQRQVVDNDC